MTRSTFTYRHVTLTPHDGPLGSPCTYTPGWLLLTFHRAKVCSFLSEMCPFTYSRVSYLPIYFIVIFFKQEVMDNVQGNKTKNAFSFTNLMPWSSYSVIVCPSMKTINVNKTTCTCGDYQHQPEGPVFNQTLPEGKIYVVCVVGTFYFRKFINRTGKNYP